MIRQDPILIATPPRSGTTMVAGLLHLHGVWVGRARTTRYPGTNSDFGSENIDIKNIFKKKASEVGYQNWNTPFPDFGVCSELKDKIERFVPNDTPWLVKTSWCLIFWKFWVISYPDARWLFLTRDTLKILDSMNRHPGMRKHPDHQKHQYISHLLCKASDVIDLNPYYTFVDVEAIADCDKEEVDRVLGFVGLTPDYDIASNWLQSEMLKR